MKDEKKKEGEFDPGCITDIYEELYGHSTALRAFATLLCSSDLADFTEESYGEGHEGEASTLRYGLSQIIELWLDRQKCILSGYVDQYRKSDFAILKHAAGLINMVDQGASNSKEAVENQLREEIADLDIVINRHGEREAKAHELKGVYLKYLKQFTSKKEPGLKQPD